MEFKKKKSLKKSHIFITIFYNKKQTKKLANNKKYTFYTLKKIYRAHIYNNLTISCNAV